MVWCLSLSYRGNHVWTLVVFACCSLQMSTQNFSTIIITIDHLSPRHPILNIFSWNVNKTRSSSILFVDCEVLSFMRNYKFECFQIQECCLVSIFECLILKSWIMVLKNLVDSALVTKCIYYPNPTINYLILF